MEDHGGRLVLEDREAGLGARAVLILPAAPAAARPEEMAVSMGRVDHGA
jgi:hypothetical protein